MTTIAGGSKGTANGVGAAAQFTNPVGLAFFGGLLYIADLTDNTIRRLDPSTGEVTGFAGLSGVSGTDDGPLSSATFSAPSRLAFDRIGNVYVADCALIRRIDLTTGVVSTLAGTRESWGFVEGHLPASLGCSRGLAVKSNGDLVVTDMMNGVVAVMAPL